jgi:hypothetical protein
MCYLIIITMAVDVEQVFVIDLIGRDGVVSRQFVDFTLFLKSPIYRCF